MVEPTVILLPVLPVMRADWPAPAPPTTLSVQPFQRLLVQDCVPSVMPSVPPALAKLRPPSMIRESEAPPRAKGPGSVLFRTTRARVVSTGLRAARGPETKRLAPGNLPSLGGQGTYLVMLVMAGCGQPSGPSPG